MTDFLHVDVLTPTLAGVPGEVVVARLRVEHTGDRPLDLHVRVLGLDAEDVCDVLGGAVAPHRSIEVEVPVVVPPDVATGRHRVAFEVSDADGRLRPALVRAEIRIASVRRVVTTPSSTTVHGRGRGRLELEIVNGEPDAVDLHLTGEGADVTASFERSRVHLEHGERVTTRVQLRGKRHLRGEPIQRIVTLTARGPVNSSTSTVRFVQRPIVPWRLRIVVAALTIVALAVAGGLVLIDRIDRHRADQAADATGTGGAPGSSDGTTVDGSSPTGTSDATGGGDGGAGDANGGNGGSDGTGGTGGGGSGNGGATGTGSDGTSTGAGTAGGGTGSADAEKRKQATALYGTIELTDGADAVGVQVVVTPIGLDTPDDPQATLVRPGAAGDERPAKVWSARARRSPDTLGDTRITESIRAASATSRTGGEWFVDEVPLRQNYRVEFSKDGYSPKAFVVSPPDSGDRVELNVELSPSPGVIRGSVVDAAGPLGGVSLEITDGKYTAATTSNTTATPATADAGATAVGDFKFDRLGVPAVYTVTARLAGYGTEVVQYPMPIDGPEVEAPPIVMQQGVGSIEGKVTLNGVGVGGARIVATLGDEVFTTTSLTDGKGTYVLPRLPKSTIGKYTVTASLAGASTQTREVEVTGPVGNQDFPLETSTGGITGSVVDTSGRPIIGALVTITRDDIEFVARTAGQEGRANTAAPSAFGGIPTGTSFLLRTAAGDAPGEFAVGDLPPGRYVVTIQHYGYRPYAAAVDVDAGPYTVLPAPIALDALPVTGDAVGTLVVQAIDEETDKIIENATFVVRSETTTATRAPTGGAPALEQTFAGLPVGTYTITVSRDGYRDEQQRASIGLGSTTVQVRMRPKGPLSITVVDRSLGGEPVQLDNDLDIVVRNVADTTIVLQGSVVHEPTGSKVYWETDSDKVDNGTWQIEVTQQPQGFFVPRQVPEGVAADHVPAGTTMVFRIDRNSPSELNIVLAARAYPEVVVTLFEPTGNGTTVARFDAPSTTVSLVCPAGTAAFAQVQTASGRDPGSYRIDPERVQTAAPDPASLSACVIDAASPGSGLDPKRITFAQPLALGTFTARRHHQIRSILLPPKHTVTGSVFWLSRPGDPTSRIALPGVPIGAVRVVTGYSEDQTIDGRTPNTPGALQSDVAAVWAPDGTFVLDQQVFGTTGYTIDAPDIAPGVFQITVPPSPSLVTASSGVVITEVPDADPNDHSSSYDFQLTNPAPGRLAGCLRRFSLTPDEPLSSIGIVATPPGSTGPPAAVVIPAPASITVPGVCDATFAIDPAMAGDWSVAFQPPPNHVLTTTTPQTPRVLPGQTVTDLTATVVEQATITLSVHAAGSATALPVTATVSGGLLVPPLTNLVTAVASLDTAITGIPVDVTAADPTTVFLPYVLAITAPGYDTLGATITVDGVVLAAPASPAPRDATHIAVALAAGSDVHVEVSLPAYGSISGSVVGKVSDEIAQTAFLEHRTTSISQPASLQVQVRRVRLSDGTPITVTDADWQNATITPGTLAFSFTGAPGSYEVRIRHELYQTWTNTDGGGALAVLANGADLALGAIELRPNPGTLSLHVLQAAGGLGVAGATVRLYRNDGETVFPSVGSRTAITLAGASAFPYGAAVRAAPSELAGLGITEASFAIATANGAGDLELTGLVPGTYWLELRLTGLRSDGSTGDLYYPVIAAITIPFGATAGDATLTVTAIMPPQAGAIAVAIHVLNDDGSVSDPFPGTNFVPVPAGVQLRRTFVAPPLAVTPGASPTTSLVANTLGDDQTVGPTATTSQELSFVFGNLPAGTHTLEVIGMPAAYTLVNPDALSVGVTTGTSSVTLNYRVTDLDLVIEPTDTQGESILDAPGLSATLLYQGAVVSPSPIGLDSDGRLRFRGVAPRALPYDVRVDSDLHVAKTISVPVTPTTGTCPGIPTVPCTVVAVTGVSTRASRITGSFGTSQLAGGVTSPAPASAVLEVRDANGAVVTIAPAEQYAGSGTYSFTVPGGGTYKIRATLPDVSQALVDRWGVNSTTYTVEEITVTVRDGKVARQADILLRRKATVSVTLTSPPSTASVEVLPPGTGILPTRSGNTWSFRVLPGDAYRFHVQGDDAGQYWYPVDVPATAQTYAYGTTTTYTPTLVQRTVSVGVTRAGTGAVTATVTVEVLDTNPDPPATATLSFLAADPADTLKTANFPQPAATALRIAGVGRVTVTANGYRTSTTTWPASQRAASVNLPLRPNVTLTGSIVGAPPGTPVTATSPGQTAKTVTTTGANGAFDFASTGGFGNGVWTIAADVLGVGKIAEQTFTVDQASVSIGATSSFLAAAGADGLTANAMPLVPRTIQLSLTAYRPGTTTNPLSGWTLVPAPLSTSPITFTEAGTAYTFSVVHTGSITESLSITLVSGDVGADRQISLTRTISLYEAPAISGTATPATGNVNGATVSLSAGACGTTGTLEATAVIGAGSTSFDFPATASAVTAGPHCLVVTHTAGATTTTGRLTVDVAKNPSGPATVTALATTPQPGDTITVALA